MQSNNPVKLGALLAVLIILGYAAYLMLGLA
jgi:hypothetical protein